MVEGLEKHEGFAYSRARWDWASSADHVYFITGSSSMDHFDRSGWSDACRLAELCPGYRDQTVLESAESDGQDAATDALVRGIIYAAAGVLIAALLSALIRVALPRQNRRRVIGWALAPTLIGFAVIAIVMIAARTSFHTDAFEQPKFYARGEELSQRVLDTTAEGMCLGPQLGSKRLERHGLAAAERAIGVDRGRIAVGQGERGMGGGRAQRARQFGRQRQAAPAAAIDDQPVRAVGHLHRHRRGAGHGPARGGL